MTRRFPVRLAEVEDADLFEGPTVDWIGAAGALAELDSVPLESKGWIDSIMEQLGSFFEPGRTETERDEEDRS